jgi:hypothetical protein
LGGFFARDERNKTPIHIDYTILRDDANPGMTRVSVVFENRSTEAKVIDLDVVFKKTRWASDAEANAFNIGCQKSLKPGERASASCKIPTDYIIRILNEGGDLGFRTDMI